MKISPADQPRFQESRFTPEPRGSFADLLRDDGVAFSQDDGAPPEPLTRVREQGGPAPTPSGVDGPAFFAPAVAEAPDDSRVAAATFQAFGMFGRRAGAIRPDAAAALLSRVEDAPRTDRPSDLEAALPIPLRGSGGSVAARASAIVSEKPVRIEYPRLNHRTVHTGDPAVADGLEVRATAPDEEVATANAPRRRAHVRAAGDADGARLTLTDATAAAELTVRLTGLSAEEAAQFRTRARTLLGERGLGLDKLNINGEDRSGSGLPPRGIKQWR